MCVFATKYFHVKRAAIENQNQHQKQQEARVQQEAIIEKSRWQRSDYCKQKVEKLKQVDSILVGTFYKQFGYWVRTSLLGIIFEQVRK